MPPVYMRGCWVGLIAFNGKEVQTDIDIEGASTLRFNSAVLHY